ncbi:transcription elongation factor GreA [Ketobacter sp.]|uniref:transcription elongation factor GreA n=1 Tax=Ketobacter sp. TaxID=2083498 RepID=UPI000F299FE6|nr:transcription elongation factor GreA [Ketobacter sp.]RLT99357.1 MAG: transcription elongation factor GreA [Ketobacter sp.]
MNRFPMTVQGAEKLREELDRLKKVERPRIVAAIAEAREHGDLKENAEYHAAREEQGFVEGRIMEIEGKLGNAQIIDISKIDNNGKVIFGVTVDLYDVDKDEEKTFQIVGDDEADIKQGKLSVNSPIARGLIGKFEGDEVSVDTPGGTVVYEIVKVKYL